MADIVCIEDEKIFRENLIEILQQEGYIVKGFADGSEALNYFQRLTFDPPELIICDVNLPQISGYEFLRRLRLIDNANSSIPLIFLSSMGQKHDIIKGLSLNAVDYLVKPADFDILLSKVKAFVKTPADVNAG